jgi:hypothetical protein
MIAPMELSGKGIVSISPFRNSTFCLSAFWGFTRAGAADLSRHADKTFSTALLRVSRRFQRLKR